MATVAIVENIVSKLTRDETHDPQGAEAVRTAVSEIESIKEQVFTAELGEPDIVCSDGYFFEQPKVIVPIYDAPYDASRRLVYDLPESRDDELSQFNILLDVLGVEFENMEDLAGEDVPVAFIAGNVLIDWNEVEDELDKGGESAVNVEETTISGGDTDEENDS